MTPFASKNERARGPGDVEQAEALLHAHQPVGVEGDEGARAPAAPRAAEVSGERCQQDLGALDQIRVVVLAHSELREDQRRAGLGEVPREAADHGGGDAGDARRLLGSEALEPLAQQREDRSHRDAAPRGERHLGAHVERRAHAARELEGLLRAAGAAGCPDHLALRLVPEREEIVLAVLHQVRLAQVAPRIVAHQEGEIALLDQVVGVVEVLLDHHLAGGERQRRVGSGPHRQPQVGVDGALVVIRGDRGHAGSVVAGLVNVVRVRDARGHGVEGPEHEVVRAEPVIGGAVDVRRTEGDGAPHGEVADLRHRVGDGGADHPEEADPGHGVRPVVDVGAELEHGPLAAAALQHLDQRGGDLVQGLVPADPLPASLPARAHPPHRMRDPRRAQHHVTATRALLAAARVPVGKLRVRGDVGCGLLLAPDDALAHVEVPRAGGDAVHVGVGAANHPVPAPALAVDVAKVAVGGRGRLRDQRIRRPGQPLEAQRQRRRRTRLEKLASGQARHAASSSVAAVKTVGAGTSACYDFGHRPAGGRSRDRESTRYSGRTGRPRRSLRFSSGVPGAEARRLRPARRRAGSRRTAG